MAAKTNTAKAHKSAGAATRCAKTAARPVACARGARAVRLERIRKEIESGTYETEGKLRIAISRLIDDVLGKYRKGQR